MQYDHNRSEIDSNIVPLSNNVNDNRTNGIECIGNHESTFCSEFEKRDAKNDTDDDDYKINIFRYKFEDNFTSELYAFAKIHQYDHRKDFKEAWENWVKENEELVDREVRRLTNIGYDGDIIDKMFKSARDYFRKKSSVKKTPQKRRNYITIQKDLLAAIDNHVKTNINTKPSIGFDIFCKENIELLKNEIVNLCKSGITDHNEIRDKFKKTYKNRYFMITKKESL